ncbi:TraB/GumN family protein [Paracoccus alkanivorans]|uniref:TraB/GumN family protein n=1 Tax=Paracoccus alkanivorans TaxID=2116655 RepID=A0A3M0MXU9_9RHOB|nr:TraB/GumN family protein [Paracoccus alkanivorans]RMC36187.1 TraB/GumN family protein [Paracoccus alkanivorans]
MRVFLAGIFALWAGAAGAAICEGRNLIDALPTDTRTRLDAAVAEIPYHSGILWRASKDRARITLVGTYHFPDPRHQRMLERLAGPLKEAAALFVEAGPAEEARLTRELAEDPSLMVNQSGPTLPERLSEAEWETLSSAMTERGLPPVVTAKLRPWYVAMMIGVSPCVLRDAGQTGDLDGLDHLLIEKAEEAELPIRALEPWDTILTLFSGMTPEEEEDMIRSALPAAAYADDYAVTLTDAYFSGEVWEIWEFGRIDAYENSGLTREEVDQQFAFAQTRLMDQRNQDWIGRLTQGARDAAQEGKGIVAGFGALHLPGEQGVLRLLEKQGWEIERLDG